MVERLPEWEKLLIAFVEERRARPFKWGEHDCGLFAADAVAAITGTDFAADVRGYSTAVGASRKLSRIGVGDVAGFPAHIGLVPRLHVIDARRGDVVSWRGQLGISLGVVLGERFTVPGPERLLFFPLDQAVRAWKVG